MRGFLVSLHARVGPERCQDKVGSVAARLESEQQWAAGFAKVDGDKLGARVERERKGGRARSQLVGPS